MTPEEDLRDYLSPCSINESEFTATTQVGDPVNPRLVVRDLTIDEIKTRCRWQVRYISKLESRLEIHDEIADLKARLSELE
jgi:hypothetical protein